MSSAVGFETTEHRAAVWQEQLMRRPLYSECCRLDNVASWPVATYCIATRTWSQTGHSGSWRAVVYRRGRRSWPGADQGPLAKPL